MMMIFIITLLLVCLLTDWNVVCMYAFGLDLLVFEIGLGHAQIGTS